MEEIILIQQQTDGEGVSTDAGGLGRNLNRTGCEHEGPGVGGHKCMSRKENMWTWTW